MSLDKTDSALWREGWCRNVPQNRSFPCSYTRLQHQGHVPQPALLLRMNFSLAMAQHPITQPSLGSSDTESLPVLTHPASTVPTGASDPRVLSPGTALMMQTYRQKD